MVSLAYLMTERFRSYKQRRLTLMATVHPEEGVPREDGFFIYGCTPKVNVGIDDSNCCVRSRGIPPCHSIAGMKRAIKNLVSMVRFVVTIPQTRNAIVGLPPTVATVRPKSPALDLSWQLSHKTSLAKCDRIQYRRDFTANDEIEKSPRLSRTGAIFGY